MDKCVFCSITKESKGEEIIFEDEHFIAFLDYTPIFKGHTLLIPKKHYQTIFDLPDGLLEKMSVVLKRLSEAVKAGTDADGILLINNNIVSQSVPHYHIHVVPRHSGVVLKGFMWPRQKYSSGEEKDGYARAIRDNMKGIMKEL